MAKVKQFEKVLKILQDASPEEVSKETLAAALGTDVAMYRISTYIWEVRKQPGVPVEAVKDGRRVTGFKIPVEVDADASDASPEASAGFPSDEFVKGLADGDSAGEAVTA